MSSLRIAALLAVWLAALATGCLSDDDVLLVTDPSDEGPGTLRWAVGAAAAGDTILFAVSDVYLSHELTVPRSMVIDGEGAVTIHGAADETGLHASGGAIIRGVTCTEAQYGVYASGRCTLTGCAFYGNSIHGVYGLQCDGIVLTNNVIGRNGTDGIYIADCQSGVIENNVIGGNTKDGVYCLRSDSVLIRGNLVGLDASGAAWPNKYGVFLDETDNSELRNNVVSGNSSDGVVIARLSDSNRLLGNRIGTDTTGTVAIPNKTSGLFIFGGSYNVIGGPGESDRNVISGNGGCGIYDKDSSHNTIAGNYIGLTSGGKPCGNGLWGIGIMYPAACCTIGGDTETTANVIAHNRFYGIAFYDRTGTQVLRNLIYSNGDNSTQVGKLVGTNDAITVTLIRVSRASGFVEGRITSNYPSMDFLIHLYTGREPERECPLGDAEKYAGQTTASTNLEGNATFSTTLSIPIQVDEMVCAIATPVTECVASSAMSRPAGDPTINTPSLCGATRRSYYCALEGVADPRARLVVYEDGEARAAVTADESGNWDTVILAGVGERTLRVRYVGGSGGGSASVKTDYSASGLGPWSDCVPLLKIGDILGIKSLSLGRLGMDIAGNPGWSHVSLYLGGDPSGTPEVGWEPVGIGKVVPLDTWLAYDVSSAVVRRLPSPFPTRKAVSQEVRDRLAQVVDDGQYYQDVQSTLIGAAALASEWWDPVLDDVRPENRSQFDSLIGAMDIWKDPARSGDGTCATVAWKAILDGSGIDVSDPNAAHIGGLLSTGLTQKLAAKLAPHYVIADTIIDSPKLIGVWGWNILDW